MNEKLETRLRHEARLIARSAVLAVAATAWLHTTPEYIIAANERAAEHELQLRPTLTETVTNNPQLPLVPANSGNSAASSEMVVITNQ